MESEQFRNLTADELKMVETIKSRLRFIPARITKSGRVKREERHVGRVRPWVGKAEDLQVAFTRHRGGFTICALRDVSGNIRVGASRRSILDEFNPLRGQRLAMREAVEGRPLLASRLLNEEETDRGEATA